MQKRLGDEELTLKLTDAGSDFLVKHGYDEKFGARPLKRAIQKYIEDPLSEKILLGEYAKGDEIEVECRGRWHAAGLQSAEQYRQGIEPGAPRARPPERSNSRAAFFCLISTLCGGTSEKPIGVYLCDA